MTPLDYLAKEYVELTMVKQRYDSDDVYFFVDRPFWKRDSLNFSHEYKFAPGTPVPEYPARSLNNILVEAERLLECLKSYRATVGAEEEMRNDYLIEHTENLVMRTRVLLGEKMPYDEMTEKCFGLVSPKFDVAKFDNIISDLSNVLPLGGSIPDRIAAFREMICSDTVEEREAALEKILPYQQGDFEKLYEALEGCPVTIRFLDPPLHEFVPTEEEDIKKLADAQGKSVEQIKAIIASLHEFNPMMGHRGLRLAVTYPEIAKMQTKAVIRAAINVKKAHPDWTVKPEIMIPLVCEVKELKYVKKMVVETADAEIAAAGIELEYEVGTMIEIPRAALTADEIATEADFFCFGTNDLTQMTFGFSRDDAGKFLNAYYDAKIFENDPFAKLDQTGVGKLMETAIKLGKPVNNKLHVGICGEHGGDPSSVEFCHKIGLDYVSCSPFRVPIARLAAAQAAIAEM